MCNIHYIFVLKYCTIAQNVVTLHRKIERPLDFSKEKDKKETIIFQL